MPRNHHRQRAQAWRAGARARGLQARARSHACIIKEYSTTRCSVKPVHNDGQYLYGYQFHHLFVGHNVSSTPCGSCERSPGIAIALIVAQFARRQPASGATAGRAVAGRRWPETSSPPTIRPMWAITGVSPTARALYGALNAMALLDALGVTGLASLPVLRLAR